jgi:hypothetical protein
MIDYGESIIKVRQLEKALHEQLLKRDYPEAFKLATDLKEAAEDLQKFCLNAVKA